MVYTFTAIQELLEWAMRRLTQVQEDRASFFSLFSTTIQLQLKANMKDSHEVEMGLSLTDSTR
jgi:hypothetical protein